MEASINHLAAIAAAISTFVLGGIWYNPKVFGKIWQRACGLSDEKIKEANMGKVFGFAFLFSLIMAYNLAFFLNDPTIDVTMGALYGFLTGFGWVLMAIGLISMFEQKSWAYILVNGGYMTVAFTLMGMILGAWK